eukprot:m.151606 g.151606  ORF g.151606 m.151606 type:complete len:745 (+) comp10154_c0_seq1:287-2521(+)
MPFCRTSASSSSPSTARVAISIRSLSAQRRAASCSLRRKFSPGSLSWAWLSSTCTAGLSALMFSFPGCQPCHFCPLGLCRGGERGEGEGGCADRTVRSRVLHRDLKTKNVFLRKNVIKLGDFGIARVLMGTNEQATTIAGTPYYMSPEALQSCGYNARSDMWSLGCILYEMCKLEPAFSGTGLMGVMFKICEGKPPEIPIYYDRNLRDLCAQLLDKDPEQRPSAHEMLRLPFMQSQLNKMRDSLSRHSAKQRHVEDDQQRLRELAKTKRKREPPGSTDNFDIFSVAASPVPMSPSLQDSYDFVPSSLTEEHERGNDDDTDTGARGADGDVPVNAQERMRRRRMREADERARVVAAAAAKNREESARTRHRNASRQVHSSNVRLDDSSSSAAPPDRDLRTSARLNDSIGSSSRLLHSTASSSSSLAPPDSPFWMRDSADRPLDDSSYSRRTPSPGSARRRHDTDASPSSRPRSGSIPFPPRSPSTPCRSSRPGSGQRATSAGRPVSSERPLSGTSPLRNPERQSSDHDFLPPPSRERPRSGRRSGRQSAELELSGSSHSFPHSSPPGEAPRWAQPSPRAQRRSFQQHRRSSSAGSHDLAPAFSRLSMASSEGPPETADAAASYYQDDQFEALSDSDEDDVRNFHAALSRCVGPENDSGVSTSNSLANTTSDLHDPEPLRAKQLARARKEAQQALGSQFVPVYDFLKRARTAGWSENAILSGLGKLVDDIPACSQTDLLVCMELNP